MGKYIKKFDTHSDYEEFIESQNFIKPNVSYCEEQVDVHYNGLKPMMIIKYIGDGSNSVNILQKELNAFGDTYTLNEQSIDKMILDENQIDFSDLTVVSNGAYGATSNVYAYVFNDTSEHTLKIFSNNSVSFRLSSWAGSGPTAPSSTYFSKVSEIILSDQITSISNKAFKYCTYLSSIAIPNSVTSIGESAFLNCTGLTSVTIPNSVTSIGYGAFAYCSGLTSVHISDLAAWCNISFNSDESNPLHYAHHLYLNGTEVTDLIIPDGVTSIGNQAFNDCSGLTSVTIPNSVTYIGSKTFSSCIGLTSITIPNSVITIGASTFEGCSGLTSVTIGNSVTQIGITAFKNCSNLTNITFTGTTTQWNNITKGSNWNYNVPATAVHCSDGDVTL